MHSFLHGYKLAAATGQVYATTWSKGPFLSLFERRSMVSPVGALCMNHRHLPDRFPATQDDQLRGYVQVIHGGNIANALRDGDELVDASVLEEGFPLLGCVPRDRVIPIGPDAGSGGLTATQ